MAAAARLVRAAQEKRHADRLVPGVLLAVHSLRSQHVAVVGGVDEDGVLAQAGRVDGGDDAGKLLVQRGDVGAIPCEVVADRIRAVRRNLDVRCGIAVQVLLRQVAVGVVRRPPGENQRERDIRRPRRNVVDGHVGLRNGVVAVPPQPFRRVPIVEGPQVVVGAVGGSPEAEPLAARARRRERAPTVAVQVPLADVRGVVAGVAEDGAEGRPVGGKPHVVEEHAVGERILAGEHRGAPRGTDGNAGDRRVEHHPLRRQAVHRRGLDGGSLVACRTRAVLVGEDEDDVGVSRHRLYPCSERPACSSHRSRRFS